MVLRDAEQDSVPSVENDVEYAFGVIKEPDRTEITDVSGRIIKEGDLVVSAQRRGSTMWLLRGVVQGTFKDEKGPYVFVVVTHLGRKAVQEMRGARLRNLDVIALIRSW
jgi:hypothetical protein